MSTTDDQAKEVPVEAAQEPAAAETPAEMTETPGPAGGAGEKEGATGFIILFFIVGFVISLVIGWVIFPKILYSQKKQPIDFNHVLHMEAVGEGCACCHGFREDGSFTGVPKLSNCVECHEEAQGENPEEVKFVTEYVAKGREVPWLIYSRQPACVFFSHAAHVKAGEMACETCHGSIGESTTSRVYEENRISGYSRDIWGKNIAGLKKHTYDRMKMDDCAECHKKKTGRITSAQTVADACFVCHK